MKPSGLQEPARTLSPAVREARDELVSLMQWLKINGKDIGGFHGDLRNMMAAACFDQVLEHQGAVLVLVEEEMYGSALALLRCMAEAIIRGMWFHHCATDAELQRFKKHDRIDKV
jgi:Family of unknown function (DUF6988)